MRLETWQASPPPQGQDVGADAGNLIYSPSPSRIVSEPWLSHLPSGDNEIYSAVLTGE